jgi:hypothetical protein
MRTFSVATRSARKTYQINNCTANRVAKDNAKETAVQSMRVFARENLRFNPAIDDGTRLFLGLRKLDTTKSVIRTPMSQCTATVKTPGLHMVEIDLTAYAELSANERGNYGVRIYWGILTQGGTTLEMAAGPKHYLVKPPTTGEELGNSVFTRRKKYLFNFDGDSGNRVFFFCRWENSKGEAGPFGPPVSTIIT